MLLVGLLQNTSNTFTAFRNHVLVCTLFAVYNVALLLIFACNAGIILDVQLSLFGHRVLILQNASVFKSTKRRKVRKVSSINAVEEGASLITGSVNFNRF